MVVVWGERCPSPGASDVLRIMKTEVMPGVRLATRRLFGQPVS